MTLRINRWQQKLTSFIKDARTEWVKGTNAIYFNISFNIVNQNPMSPRTDYYCKPQRLHVFLGEIAYFVIPCLLARWLFHSNLFVYLKYLNLFFDCKAKVT